MALHQAIKFDKSGKQLLALGQAGKSGSGPKAFCKPTQVAVGRDGSIYVSGAQVRVGWGQTMRWHAAQASARMWVGWAEHGGQEAADQGWKGAGCCCTMQTGCFCVLASV